MNKKEKNRIAIIRAAREAFTAKGYAKTTMDDIARASGKAKSTLYYYFESKEAAFREVIDMEAATLKKRLEQIVFDPKRKAQQKLEDYILFRWKAFEELGNNYKTMRKKFLENMDFVEKYRRRFDELEKQFLGTILRQGVEQKEFRIPAENIDMVATVIFLSMKALEVPFFARGEMATITSKLKGLTEVLFYGIVAD
jgi:AcrR family transcriptional regulator